MFNNQILRILTQMCSPCKNSRQIMANAKIHGKCQNSRLPWIPWIRDFRLVLIISIRLLTFSLSIQQRVPRDLIILWY